MRKVFLMMTAAAAAWAAPVPAAATEDALYGAPVPHDAVFLRRIGGAGDAVTAFGQALAAAQLPEQVYAAAAASALPGAEPGRHYTLLPAPDGSTRVVAEPPRENSAKVYLFLLNEGRSPARLLADGGATVIGDTQPAAIGTRAVNPVTAGLRVETGGRSETFTVTLRRGQDLTFLVTEDAISLVPHAYGPVIGAE